MATHPYSYIVTCNDGTPVGAFTVKYHMEHWLSETNLPVNFKIYRGYGDRWGTKITYVGTIAEFIRTPAYTPSSEATDKDDGEK